MDEDDIAERRKKQKRQSKNKRCRYLVVGTFHDELFQLDWETDVISLTFLCSSQARKSENKKKGDDE